MLVLFTLQQRLVDIPPKTVDCAGSMLGVSASVTINAERSWPFSSLS
jgi:hypothetical protein